MLHRRLTDTLRAAAATSPIVTLTGPRQSGKTTLVRALLAASLLRNGIDLTVRDIDRDVARPFVEAGARWGRARRR